MTIQVVRSFTPPEWPRHKLQGERVCAAPLNG
jgi:hypothetical protein